MTRISRRSTYNSLHYTSGLAAASMVDIATSCTVSSLQRWVSSVNHSHAKSGYLRFVTITLMCSKGSQHTAGCIHPFPAVRLRGLPFGASKEEVADFLGIVPIDIVFQERGGRPNGVAFVLCATNEDQQQAISQDKQNLGTRYIEVFACIRTVRLQVQVAHSRAAQQVLLYGVLVRSGTSTLAFRRILVASASKACTKACRSSIERSQTRFKTTCGLERAATE